MAAPPPPTTDEPLFTIQTDTVLDDTTTPPLPPDSLSPTTTSTTRTTDFTDQFATTPVTDYSGPCATPMQTGNRPWWAWSGYDPFDCGTSLITLNWTIYCCNGNVIDLTESLRKQPNEPVGRDLCFENLRCCSGDPALTIGSETTCSVGKLETMALESSVSEAFYGTASMTNESQLATVTGTRTGFTGGAAATTTSSVGSSDAGSLVLGQIGGWIGLIGLLVAMWR